MISWENHFVYDETSPTCLKWNSDRLSGKNYHIVHRKQGSTAGNLIFNLENIPLYIEVRIGNITYKTGRIVWELLVGPLDKDQIIDHLDGNPHNNKIENLEPKTLAENSRNRKLPSNNKTGIIGVYWRGTTDNQKAVAKWTNLNGKVFTKSFSANKYGYIKALKLAINCRQNAIGILNTQNAKYSERHGQC